MFNIWPFVPETPSLRILLYFLDSGIAFSAVAYLVCRTVFKVAGGTVAAVPALFFLAHYRVQVVYVDWSHAAIGIGLTSIQILAIVCLAFPEVSASASTSFYCVASLFAFVIPTANIQHLRDQVRKNKTMFVAKMQLKQKEREVIQTKASLNVREQKVHAELEHGLRKKEMEELEAVIGSYAIDGASFVFYERDLIGIGSFGRVYKTMYRGTPVAAKVLVKLNEKSVKEFYKECRW